MHTSPTFPALLHDRCVSCRTVHCPTVSFVPLHSLGVMCAPGTLVPMSGQVWRGLIRAFASQYASAHCNPPTSVPVRPHPLWNAPIPSQHSPSHLRTAQSMSEHPVDRTGISHLDTPAPISGRRFPSQAALPAAPSRPFPAQTNPSRSETPKAIPEHLACQHTCMPSRAKSPKSFRESRAFRRGFAHSDTPAVPTRIRPS